MGVGILSHERPARAGCAAAQVPLVNAGPRPLDWEFHRFRFANAERLKISIAYAADKSGAHQAAAEDAESGRSSVDA
jgi:hypothetical protein